MELGKYLQKLRKEKGKSLRQVEQETGVNNAHLSQLENGKIKNPSKDIIKKLENYYGFDIRKLDKFPNNENEKNNSPYEPFSIVSAQDIVGFSDKALSEKKAPQIVRNLIVSTVIYKQLRMPAGEGTSLPGWDGQVVCERGFGNQFVPDGNSFWEISKGKNTKPKATEDFKKRTENPLGANTKNSTYVVVTLRRWPGKKEQWITEMNQWIDENKMPRWKSIRIIDAEDLELWFEKSPSVALQFAQFVRTIPIKAKPLKRYWDEWFRSTEIGINETLLLEAGRNFHHQFSDFLKDISASYFEIKSHDKSLAIAYIYAAIKIINDEILRESLLSRAVVVEDKEAFEKLSNPGSCLLLIPLFKEPPIGIARKNGHRIICLSSDIKEDSKNIIDRISKESIINFLKREGAIEEEAQRYASKCHGNLSTLRRLLCPTSEIERPEWSKLPIAYELAPLTLFGSWSEINKYDIEFISSVTNKDYEDIKKDLMKIISCPNSPLKKFGNIYTFNQELTFDELYQFLDTDFIIKFLEKSSKDLLSKYDNRFDKDGKERFFPDRKFLHSSYLRKGVAISYALLGNHYTHSNFPNIKLYVNKAVKEILEKEYDWKYWVSISDILTLLAEASPDEFLNRLDEICKSEKTSNESENFFKIFEQKDHNLFGGCDYASLLWSLELCAWEKQYLKCVTEILLIMSQHEDSSSNWANKPSRTLQNLYRLQMPQTSCTFKERLKILDCLFEKNKDQIWRLFLKIIPSKQLGILNPNQKAKYRDIQLPFDEVKTYGDIRQFVNALYEKIQYILEKEPIRWLDFVDYVLEIPFGDKKIKFLKILKEFDVNTFSNEDRLNIWEKIEKQYSYSLRGTSNNSEESMKFLKEIYERFTPIDPVEKWKRVFDYLMSGFTHPSVIEENIEENGGHDYVKMDREMETVREKGLKEIIEISGDKGVMELIEKIECIHILGDVYAKVLNDKDKKEKIICEFDFSDRKKDIFYESFARRCFSGNNLSKVSSEGIGWIEKVIKNNQLEDNRVVKIFSSLPFSKETWDLVEKYPKNIQDGYWNTIKPLQFLKNYEDVLWAGKKLLYYKRPYFIFQIVSYLNKTELNKLPTDFLMKILSDLNHAPFNKKDFKQINDMFSYHLEKILKFLEKKEDVDRKKLAQIVEWPLMNFSYPYGKERPENLINEVNKTPKIFLELLKLAYKRDDGSTENNNQPHELSKRAYQFFQMYVSSPDTKDDSSIDLYTKVKLPGMNENGKLDSDEFRRWVSEVRKLCKEHHRIKSGDYILGQLFAHAPFDNKDQKWPHQAIRETIEELKGDRLDEGFVIGVINKRGVSSRDIYEGGEQERKLADKYKFLAEKITIHWPRTAGLLRKIEKEYLSMGRMWDNEARLKEHQND